MYCAADSNDVLIESQGLQEGRDMEGIRRYTQSGLQPLQWRGSMV
jgi:hypothetical protein